MKNWKDVTKLDKIDKGRIAICIVMIIYTIASAIILKNIAWFVCALLWGNIAVIIYFDAKLLKGKNYIIKK